MKTLITKPQAGFSGNEKNSSVITAQAVLRKNLPRDKTMKTRTNKSFLTLLLQLLIINCVLLIATATADATIRYVSPHGSNEPPYTSWATSAHSIQMCIDISEPGDTIYVGNGVYVEQVIMIPGLTLIGAGMDSCIIDTRSISPPFTISLSDSCYLSGFQVLSRNITTGTAVRIYDVNIEQINATIEYNLIKYAKNGIRATTSSLGVDYGIKVINNNILMDVEDGIISLQTNPIITENLIVPLEDGLVSQILSNPVYLNNIIVTIDAPSNRARGFLDLGGNSSTLKNNLFYGRGREGMWSFGPDIIINNIVYGRNGRWSNGIIGEPGYVKNNDFENVNVGFQYTSGGGYPLPVFQYNNMWNNTTNYHNFTPDSTNLNYDPMFVDPDSMDFKLQMFSPLIDAGDPNILDVDGSRSDIGLFGGPYGMSYQYIDLPPRPPQNVMAVLDTADITIKWNQNTEADFNHYKLFRDTTANFIADSTTFVMSLTDTFYNHIIPPGINNYYYKLTAVDNQRNESLPSEEIAVNISSMTISDYPMTINDYILYQNYPNPFNPATRIAYRLKEGGYVKLYVYDIKGELVDILVNQHQEGGYYEVEFHTGVRSQQTEDRIGLASGIYIYQIMVRSNNNIPVFTDMKKMIYVK